MLLLVGVGHMKTLLKLQPLLPVEYSPINCCESPGRHKEFGEDGFAADVEEENSVSGTRRPFGFCRSLGGRFRHPRQDGECGQRHRGYQGARQERPTCCLGEQGRQIGCQAAENGCRRRRPQASPVSLPAAWNCSAAADAATAVTPPAAHAKTTAPQSAAAGELTDMRANIGTGRAMVTTHSHSSVARRPNLSEIAPAYGATAITGRRLRWTATKSCPPESPRPTSGRLARR